MAADPSSVNGGQKPRLFGVEGALSAKAPARPRWRRPPTAHVLMLSPSGLLGIESSSGGEVLAAGWLFQNRDYPVLNEYRALFGGLFVRLCGLNAA